MVSSRTATAVVGLGLSLAVSVAVWVTFHTLLVFLVVPFVPLLFRRTLGRPAPPVKRCPTCGFASRAAEVAFCPRDGTALETERR